MSHLDIIKEAERLNIIKEVESIIGKKINSRDPNLVWMNENSYALNQQKQFIALNLKNKIDDISFLKTHQYLQVLSLYDNEIEDINALKELKNLKLLYLNNNKITDIGILKYLKNLRLLNLSNNLISDISSLKELKNLKSINLSHNLIVDFAELKKLKNLIRLDLSYNKITTLPLWVMDLGLEIKWNFLEDGFCLEGNPLWSPPPEIIKQGNNAIGTYLTQLEQQGSDYLYEAKLILVGEGGSGKTSLANKIINNNYQLLSEIESKSTQGIDILHYQFPYKNKLFQVNIWDFGGQEIYHQTHQFFLSKRSLYFLVTDNRKENTDFYYWLNTVSMLSNNSPLLIIKNEKCDRYQQIQESQLKSEFNNVKDIFATNLSNNYGLNCIIANLHHYLSQLPHIGSPLPKTWVKIREQLEQNNNYVIDVKEYFKICQENGFEKEIDKLQLSEYLHDLGVCLHFQDDELLCKILILNPSWATGAVYKVLDNRKVINNFGCFNKQDLITIWQNEQYNNLRGELLALMKKFKLCYEIPNEPFNYIAPQLLKENPPNYIWETDNNLLLRFRYDFMPKGIISQFIVVMHKYIANNYQWVWKTGVILKKDFTQAEIIEYYSKREIHIRVKGQNKKELLNIVSYELDKINNNYKRLKNNCKKLIPCHCDTCKQLQEPNFFDYDELKERIAYKFYYIECRKPPFNKVNILKLIGNVVIQSEVKKMQVAPSIICNYFGDTITGDKKMGDKFNIKKVNNTKGIIGKENQISSTPESPPDTLFKNPLFYLGLGGFIYFCLILFTAYDLQKHGKLGDKSFKEIVLSPIPLLKNDK
jgi:internalin A